jgi:flagellar protein FlaG
VYTFMKIDGITSVQSFHPFQQNTMPCTAERNFEGMQQEERVPIENTEEQHVNFPGETQFIEAIEHANKDLKVKNTSLHFSIHEKTKAITVKVIDNETKEILREIPPEKILDMVAVMLEKTGLFFDKRG